MTTAIRRNRFARLAWTALLPLALALPAAAQAPPGGGGVEESDAPEQVEEIIVTARKIEESLQDTPVAVSVFGEEAIRDLGIDSVDDVARFTPGLSFSRAFGRSTERPVVRGQSNILAGVQFGVESGTAYFVDGAYFLGDIQGLDMNEIERVEVIKGPQSALYGRNTYAGAINFITRAPDDKWHGSAKARVGEHGILEFSGGARGPLFANLFGSLQLRSWQYDGEWTNTLNGKDVGGEETQQLSVSLDWRPGENFRARARYEYNKDEDDTLALFLQGAAQNNCHEGYNSLAFRVVSRGPGVFVPAGTSRNQYFCGVIKPGTVALNTDEYVDDQGRTIPDGTAFDGIERSRQWSSLTLDWDILGSGWTATLIGNYHTTRENFGADSTHSATCLYRFFVPCNNYEFYNSNPNLLNRALSGVPVNPMAEEPALAFTDRDIVRDWSAEFRLASPADQSVRYLIGGYTYRNKEETRDIIFGSGPGGTYEGTGSGTDTISNSAVFALLAWDVTPELTLTAEGRYAKERKSLSTPFVPRSADFDATPPRPADPGWKPAFGGGRDAFWGTLSFSDFTPRFTVDYKLGGDTLLYAVFAQGTKPGGLNGPVGISVGAVTYEKEESDNIEIGVKTAWLDNRLTTNAALFRIDADNVQLTTAIPPMDGMGAVTSVATNQGSAEINGLELDFLLRVTRHLDLGVGYAWTNAEFTEGCDDFQYTLTSGGYQYHPDPAERGGDGDCSIEGKQLPLTSEHMANAWAKWERPIRGGFSLFASANVSYESSKFAQVHNGAETGDATLLGGRIGVRGNNGLWELAFTAYNLTDEDSVTAVTRWLQLGSAFGDPDDPETMANEATLNYVPSTSLLPSGVNPARVRSGAPRAFFGSLRRGRALGLELSVRF